MVDKIRSILYSIIIGRMTLGCECKYKDDSHDDHEDVGREFYFVSITILIYVFDGDHIDRD